MRSGIPLGTVLARNQLGFNTLFDWAISLQLMAYSWGEALLLPYLFVPGASLSVSPEEIPHVNC